MNKKKRVLGKKTASESLRICDLHVWSHFRSSTHTAITLHLFPFFLFFFLLCLSRRLCLYSLVEYPTVSPLRLWDLEPSSPTNTPNSYSYLTSITWRIQGSTILLYSLLSRWHRVCICSVSVSVFGFLSFCVAEVFSQSEMWRWWATSRAFLLIHLISRLSTESMELLWNSPPAGSFSISWGEMMRVHIMASWGSFRNFWAF